MWSLVHKKKATQEQLLQINHKHISSPKCFNKGTDTSGYGPPKATFQRHQPKVNPFCLNDPCGFINISNTKNEHTPLVNTTEELITEEPKEDE